MLLSSGDAIFIHVFITHYMRIAFITLNARSFNFSNISQWRVKRVGDHYSYHLEYKFNKPHGTKFVEFRNGNIHQLHFSIEIRDKTVVLR
jgi:hypothetical protein